MSPDAFLQALDELGLTQAEFARLLSGITGRRVDRATVGRWTAGKRLIDPAIEALCNSLLRLKRSGVSVEAADFMPIAPAPTDPAARENAAYDAVAPLMAHALAALERAGYGANEAMAAALARILDIVADRAGPKATIGQLEAAIEQLGQRLE